MLFYCYDEKEDAFVNAIGYRLQARTQARMHARTHVRTPRRRRLGGIRCCVSVARSLLYLSLFLISFAASISRVFLSLRSHRNFHNFFQQAA